MSSVEKVTQMIASSTQKREIVLTPRVDDLDVRLTSLTKAPQSFQIEKSDGRSNRFAQLIKQRDAEVNKPNRFAEYARYFFSLLHRTVDLLNPATSTALMRAVIFGDVGVVLGTFSSLSRSSDHVRENPLRHQRLLRVCGCSEGQSR